MKKNQLLKQTLSIVAVMAAAAMLTACGGTKQSANKSNTTTSKSTSSKKAPKPVNAADEQINTIMKHMSLKEKVGQLFLARVPATNAVSDVQTYHLGGYLLFGQDMAGQTTTSLKTKIQSYQQNSKIPLLIGSDEEGGTVTRLS